MTTAEKLRQEGLQEGLREGLREGAYETLLFMANKMKERGLPEEDIAGMLDLDLDSVKKLLGGERIDLPLGAAKGDIK
jgi:predicted transposase/invertase (TIGR01784 family)